MNINLTQQEAQVLIGLLDSANRAQGLEASSNCLIFFNKIKEAANQMNIGTKKATNQMEINTKKNKRDKKKQKR